MKTILSLIPLLLLLACQQPVPEPPTTQWVPEVDDLVESSFCAECPSGVSDEPYYDWLTRVTKEREGVYTVYADSFPDGISSLLVKPVRQ